MNSNTILRIQSCGRKRTFYQRSALNAMGYSFSSKEKEWVKEPTGDDITATQLFCRQHGFHLVIGLPQYRRSYDYRHQFFIAHPGIGKGERYFCSYCGCLLRKEKITVDHLISVNAAQKSRSTKWLLHCVGIENVNDPKNLVPSCRRCNQQKGTKCGLWLLRGLIGRHANFLVCVLADIFYLSHPLRNFCCEVQSSNADQPDQLHKKLTKEAI